MASMRRGRMGELGELQVAVLERLTALGEATVAAVQESFAETARPRYTTVATVLRALEGKGLVSHRRDGRTYVYAPVTPVAEVRSNIVADLIERAFKGSPAALVTALLDARSVTRADLEEVRRLIEERMADRVDG